MPKFRPADAPITIENSWYVEAKATVQRIATRNGEEAQNFSVPAAIEKAMNETTPEGYWVRLTLRQLISTAQDLLERYEAPDK